MQEVTIIIPNYNGKSLLENCFRTLEHQSYKDFKVLVVDNGSTDGSTDIKSDVLDVEWIALNENLGFCGAVNLAVQKTGTPYVILLNNDTETDKYFVEWLLRGIKKSDHIFSCGAQMIDYKNHEILDNAGDLYTAMGWAVARGKGRPCKDYETSKRVFSCCAGAAIYRMDIMRKIGGLDEKHFAYLEDVDLGYRARIAGFENWYIPEAKVYHVGSATTGTRYNKKKVFLAARNTIFVIYKNMPVLQLALNVPFIFIGMFIKTLFFVRKGFGEDYCKGILEGICDCKKCWKVKFRMKNLSNYFKIQLELWCNLVRII
ncbi:glycosyltransferase family 2 protein [Roseburia inulinivorans]|jgi:GT2 family glycosyltransferase|uniref:Glycosyltransferase family 2 protein n=1 Tax=Roseburia inulinivorans TaxID=360807 RepID=A0A3R5WHY7_9FIRM|nr:glycosyltransferase family 2 protein [Roseburia inulinivorans]RGR68786.1 glycosyltransferase family 2 protein [Roseburia inulinivorans]